jgi:hypothetical protein
LPSINSWAQARSQYSAEAAFKYHYRSGRAHGKYLVQCPISWERNEEKKGWGRTPDSDKEKNESKSYWMELKLSFRPQTQTPGVLHVRSGDLLHTPNKEMEMVKGRERRFIT